MVYDLCFGQQILGKANVERQGLYYRVVCDCKFRPGQRLRVRATGERGEVDLGLLVPSGHGYALRTQVAVKKLGEKLAFELVSGDLTVAGEFVPLEEGKPLSHLASIKKARLAQREGKWGLIL